MTEQGSSEGGAAEQAASDEPRATKEGPLFLIDAMSLAFRAFFALPPDLATTTGVVTNALHGFAGMLVNVVRDHRPSALAAAFDLPGVTFRHELVADYKAGRAQTPDDLMAQFGMIRRLLGVLNVPIVEALGYEADDVLATLATQARDRACDVVVVTGDRDSFQLVEDPYVRVLYNRRGVSDYSLYDEAGIVERTGLNPSYYPSLAALRGDQSDNLPGVPGVGDKTAARLLATYDDLDSIFAHLDELTPKLRESLGAHEAQVRANATAIPLVRDVPLDVTVEELSLGGWDLGAVKEVFEKYELRTLWQRTVPLLAEGRFGRPAPGSEVPPVSVGTGVGEGGDGSGFGVDAGVVATVTAGIVTDGEAVVVEGIQASKVQEVATADEAASALGSLRDRFSGPGVPGAAGTLAVAGRWEGLPGRSPFDGVALVATTVTAVEKQGPPVAVWLPGPLIREPEVAGALAGLLATAPVVGHGMKELIRSLLPLGADCTGLLMDTEVAAYLIDPSTGDYGLGTLLPSQLTAEPTAAGTGRLPLAPEAGPSDAASAVAEALRVSALAPLQRARLDAEGLGALHDDVERPLVRVLARMEVAGIRVDTEGLRQLTDDLAAQARDLVAEIHRLCGHEFNVNSTPQLRSVLYEELGLAPGRKTKTGWSTDAATLETLRGAHPVVEALLRYREIEKLRSTYGENLLAEVAPDGRIHASFRQTVARTGRLSSERPNLHNIPTRGEHGIAFRHVFVPAEGFRFLVADYDQVELRVIAHLSGDPGLVAAFTSGQDIHRTVASGVYRVPAPEVSKAQRDRAKMVSYGLAYGMEAFGLARRLSTGVDEATDIIERYFEAFPRVKAYMDETVSEARRRGYTRTEMGRKRPLPDLSTRNYRVRLAAERQAMNAGIQGLAADLFKVALVRLDRALEGGGMASRLVLQVHDEVIVEVAPEEEEPVATIATEALTGAADLSVPLEVTTAWGDSWAVKGG